MWEIYGRVCNQVLVAADGTILSLNLGTVAQVFNIYGVDEEKQADYLSLILKMHDIVCPPKKPDATPKNPPNGGKGKR